MEDQVCANCRWRENLPFSDEWICTNGNSDYADCPCEYNDTCEEWTPINEDE